MTTRWKVEDAQGNFSTLVCDTDPSEHPDYAEWDWADKTVTEVALAFDPIKDDLPTFRSYLQAKVKQLREQHKDGGLVTPFGPVETDPDSRVNINGAVQMAGILGAAFTIDWRMQDNSTTTLDAADMVNMGLLVGQHISACQYKKNELDALISAATTKAELEAIDLEDGWPGS